MSEEKVAIASRGERTSFTMGEVVNRTAGTDDASGAAAGDGAGGDDNSGANTGDDNNNTGNTAGQSAGDSNPPEFTEEQRSAFLKSLGFEGSIDDLKTKLQPTSIAPTPEQILEREKAFEKRMLDRFVLNGGKVEDFVHIKQLVTADVTEVSKIALSKELKDAGFDDDEAAVISKQLILEQDLDNLEQGTDESDADFEKRKVKLQKQVTFGAGKLASWGLPVINKAKGIYEALKKDIESQDAEEAKEAELSVTIDTHLKALPREMKIAVGKLHEKDEKDADPFTLSIPEELVSKISALLKDPKSRDAIFYDENNNLNIPKLTEILLRNEVLENAVKSSLIEGGTRQVKVFNERFPARSPHAVGVGGATPKNDTKPGAPVKRGEKQTFRPQTQN